MCTRGVESGLSRVGQIQQNCPRSVSELRNGTEILPILWAMMVIWCRCKAPWGEAIDGLEPAAYSHLMTGIKSYCCRCMCLRAYEHAYGDKKTERTGIFGHKFVMFIVYGANRALTRVWWLCDCSTCLLDFGCMTAVHKCPFCRFDPSSHF